MSLKQIWLSDKLKAELMEAMAKAEREPQSELPLAYMGTLTREACMLNDYLRKKRAPTEIVDAFKDMCERLSIPYLLLASTHLGYASPPERREDRARAGRKICRQRRRKRFRSN